MRNIQQNELAVVSGAYIPKFPDQEPGPIDPPFEWPWPFPRGEQPIIQPIVIPFGP